MAKTIQRFNSKIGRWVKGSVVKTKSGGQYFKVQDVKQSNVTKPFSGIPKR